MTPEELQRFVVRMLYDPRLVERIHGGKGVDGLDAEGRALLTRVDRRAWGTDPYRRARTLHALIEEYPGSAAEVGVAGLDTFFGDRAFHDAIQARGSLAVAFGGWIAARAGPVAEIERALVSVRRAGEGEGMGGATATATWSRAPRVVPVALPTGTCARWEALRAALGPDPVPRLLAGFRAPPRPLPRGKVGIARGRPAVEHLLVEHGAAGESVGYGSDALHGLLVRAGRPCTLAVLEAEAVRLGATRAEAVEIVAGLVDDRLLVSAP